jgi:hypothetical protein
MADEFDQYLIKNEPKGDEFDQYLVKKPAAPQEPWWHGSARTGLETLGVLGGGTVGGGLGPVGAVAGAGLGYAAAKKGEELLGLEPTPKNLVEAGKKLGTEVVAGGAMEAGGQAVGKGLQITVDYLRPLIKKLANKLYASAIKTPLGKKWTAQLPGEEISKRTKAIETGISEKVPPSEYGLEMVKKMERDTRAIVDSITTKGAQAGESINTEELIQKGFKKAYDIANKSSDPVGAKKILDSYADKFRAHGTKIPVDKANELKRQLYNEVTWMQAQKTGLGSQLKEAYKKGLAHEIMIDLESKYPALDALNQKDSARIALQQALEASLGRMGNKDVVGLGTKVLVGKETWPLAILNATIGHPQVKARLAFALSKAGAIGGKTIPAISKASTIAPIGINALTEQD